MQITLLKKSDIISLLFIFLSLIYCSKLCAQNKVEGLLKDAKENGIGFTPVVFASTNETLNFDYTITDSIGKFNFKVTKSGVYFIKVKALGFKEFKSSPIDIDVSKATTLKLNFILEEDVTSLQEVVVVSKKPLFTQKTDRLVFNVENSLASQGGDAIDALKNTPLLKVDETSVSMIGKSGLNVLINGRPIALKGEALIAYLSTISNASISKIEIITTPPAKYMAEGNAGLINIILKKNPNLGWNGSLNSSFTQKTYFYTRNSGVLNYQTNKFSMTTNLLYNYSKIAAYEKDQNVFIDGFSSINRQDKVLKNNEFTPSINLNYKFNSSTDVSLIYEYSNSKFISDDTSRSLFFDNSVLSNELLNKGYGKVHGDFNRVHSFVTKQLDSIGKSVEIGFQLLDNKVNNGRENSIEENSVFSSTQNFSVNNYKLGIANMDFTLPFKKIKTSAGAQYTFLDNKSDVRFFDIVNSVPELNPNLTNTFNYHENIWAIYASAEINLNPKWSVQGGMRYENTKYDGKSEDNTNTIERKYDNFFPTFYLSYQFSEKANYSFKYSKRVNRPILEQLNPFQWYINPFQYVEGNPQLQPSFTDNFEFTFSNNSNLSASLYYSLTKEQVSYFAEFLEDGKIQRYSYFNLLDAYQYGIYANYAFTKINNLQTQFSGSYYWQETKSRDTQLLPSSKGYGATISIDNSYKIGKNNLVQLNYSHNFPTFDGTANIDYFGFLTVGYRTSFWDKKLSLGITASTIVSKRNEISYSQIRNNATLNGQNEYDYQSLRLNLTYNFGNSKVTGSKEKSEAEEANRIK